VARGFRNCSTNHSRVFTQVIFKLLALVVIPVLIGSFSRLYSLPVPVRHGGVVRLLSKRSPNASFMLGIHALSSACTNLVICLLAPVCVGAGSLLTEEASAL